MRLLRLATIALVFSFLSMQAPTANAQILDSGVGHCKLCGHSERDTQRYVNSFMNQMFFPRSSAKRSFVAVNLYLLNATFTMHGHRSPDPDFASVTITITAEVKNALPTGNYRVTATTPGGKTSTKLYAVGDVPFVVDDRLDHDRDRSSGNRSQPPASGGPAVRMNQANRTTRCGRTRRVDLRYNTILYCMVD